MSRPRIRGICVTRVFFGGCSPCAGVAVGVAVADRVCLPLLEVAGTWPPRVRLEGKHGHDRQSGAKTTGSPATTWWCLGLQCYVVVVCCFYVGGNLLSHTLPSAVPSARAGLASGFGMGPGVSLPLSTTDKHPRHATCVALTWRVLCQILHSGREQQEFFIVSLRCVAPKPFFGFGVCLFWPISTSSLNILQCFQVWPINPIVFRGPCSETSS